MRPTVAALAMTILASPAFAGDIDAKNLFGRDPGTNPAHACFSRTFDDAWLKVHPDQNVTRLTVYVARRIGEDAIWHSGNLEIKFRDSKATYHVTAECGGEGGALGCGVDCDGGGYAMAVISKSKIGITPDDRLRYYDIAVEPSGQTTKGFTSADKNLIADRTDIKDCLPLVADEEIKAKIAEGAITQ